MKTMIQTCLLCLSLPMLAVAPACIVVDDGGDSGNDSSNDDGSNDESGGNDTSAQCSDAGEGCSQNGDCCGFDAGETGCINTGSGFVCADYCESDSDCASNCCAPLEGGGGACAPADFC